MLLLFAAAAFAVITGRATFGISRLIFKQVDLAGFACAAIIVVIAAGAASMLPRRYLGFSLSLTHWRVQPWHLGILAIALTAIGSQTVYFGYAFSMDEWMTRLQAEVFSHGQVSGIVPEAWRDYGRAMYQVFAAYDPETGRVASDYRPGMAALYALFDTLGLGPYTASILNGLSIPLVALVSLRLWPGRRDISALSALLVFSSQQALAMAMTSYAMSGHMFLNLLWIYAFTRKDWWGHIAVVVIGAYTVALHQIHVHLFFAAPFFLLLLRPFRPRLIAFYGLSYMAAHALVYSWDWWSMNRYIAGTETEARSLVERALRIAHLPSLNELLTVYANLVRLIGWQNLALVPLIAAAGRGLVTDKWLGLLGLCILTSLLPYIFLMPDQGYGWGYRYLHGLIGPMALIAGYGGAELVRAGKDVRGIAFVTLLALGSMSVMIPVRAWQIHKVVEPYARATAFVAAQDADVVIVDDYRVFIGGDIPRNSAVALGVPVQMSLSFLTAAQIEELCATHDVVYLGPDAFPKAFGLQTYPVGIADEMPGYADKLTALQSGACR